MPASISKLGVTVLEGGSVCGSSEKFVKVLHHDRDAVQLLTAYSDKLKQTGWSAAASQSKEPGYETYEKGGNKVMLHAKRCDSPGLTEYFGNCAIVEIWDDTDK